jgi:hypothetical protein
MAEDSNRPSALDFGRDLIDELTEIHRQRESILEKMRSAEQKKATVSPSVFSKVMSEFQDNLDELDRNFNQKADNLKEIMRELWEKKSKLSADCVKLRQELEEVDFKYSIGELERGEYEQIKTDRSGEIAAKEQEILEMDNHIHAARSLIVDRKPLEEAPEPTTPQAAHEERRETRGYARPTEPAHAPVAPEQAEAPAPVGEAPRHVAAGTPTLVIRDKDNREEVYEIPNGITLIGRSPENDIILLESKISRRHARITRDSQGCTLEDLGSSNGTWLNGERLPGNKPYPLRENDTLKLGETVAWFKSS